MEIIVKLDYRQALEVKGALEDRINKINKDLFQLFENDEKMTKAYQFEVETLQNTITQLLKCTFV